MRVTQMRQGVNSENAVRHINGLPIMDSQKPVRNAQLPGMDHKSDAIAFSILGIQLIHGTQSYGLPALPIEQAINNDFVFPGSAATGVKNNQPYLK